jgi:putative DNA primase/helicase
MLPAHLALAELGFATFPCDKKRPLTARGVLDASADAEQVEKWWEKHPAANIGLSTNGLVAIDVDVDGAGNANPWLANEPDKLLDLAAAPMSLTPRGGRHYLFRQPEGWRLGNTASKIAPHVDTRANGGYIIVAPSTIDGKPYRWAAGELDLRPDELPLPPAWLLDLLNPTRQREPRSAVAPAANRIPDGQRNSALTSLAGTMRRVGMSQAEILAALQTANANRCVPPLDAEEVERIAQSVAGYAPDARAVAKVETGESPARAKLPASPVLVNLADVTPRKVNWLWPMRIPVGKLTIVAGEPGLGKSFLTMDLAAHVTTGRPWPDCADNPGTRMPAGSVVLLSAEDDLEDTVRPRLDAAGADVSKVTALQGVEYGDAGNPTRQRCFNLEQDLPALELAIQAQPNCQLVIIDPITAYLGETDSHKNAEIRGLLKPLSDLAAQYGVAVVCVSHLNKASGTKAMHRVTGSLAFIAAARAGWLVAADPDDAGRRLLLPIKNNLAENIGGLAYRITDCALAWELGAVTMSADDALSDEPGEHRPMAIDPVQWLADLLAEGPLPKRDIDESAAANMLSSAMVRRAKNRLGVVARKEGFESGSRWIWFLPGYAPPDAAEDAESL